MKAFDGKLVVVTGAGGGIGRATALRFAREGARLAVCDVDQAGLDSLAGALGAQAALVAKVDVSDRAQMIAIKTLADVRRPTAALGGNRAGSPDRQRNKFFAVGIADFDRPAIPAAG